MIESPAQARRSGAPAAPPPDPRLREPDPPPDPRSRYEHACTECGTPLHDDQAACLSCGAMVPQGDGGAGVRRAALGSVTALLVLGGAVGAAVAGLPHGKKVPKPAIAQVFGTKKTPPPATAGTNGTGANPITPLPGDGSASKPPPIAPVKPHKTKTPKTKSTGSNTNSSSSSNTSSNNKSKTHKDKGTKNKPPSLHLFTSGSNPAGAEVFTSSGAQGASGETDRTTDNEAKTAWTKTHAGIGVMVAPNTPGYGGIGIVSATPGYGVRVFYTGESPAPKKLTDWKELGSSPAAGKYQQFRFHTSAAKNADQYLVWITGVPAGGKVSINEIQLLP